MYSKKHISNRFSFQTPNRNKISLIFVPLFLYAVSGALKKNNGEKSFNS